MMGHKILSKYSLFILLFLVFISLSVGLANAQIGQHAISVPTDVTTEGFTVTFDVQRVINGGDSVDVYYYIGKENPGVSGTFNPTAIPETVQTALNNYDFEKVSIPLVTHSQTPAHKMGENPYEVKVGGLEPSTTYYIVMISMDGTDHRAGGSITSKTQQTADLPMSNEIFNAVNAGYFKANGKNVAGYDNKEVTSAELNTIEELDLSGIEISDIYEIYFISKMKGLKTLDLRETGITELPIEVFTNLGAYIPLEMKSNLETLYLPETLKKGFAVGGNLVNVEIPEGTEWIVISGKFEKLNIPESVQTIGVYNLHIISLDLSTVPEILDLYCPELTDLKVSDKLTKLGFYTAPFGASHLPGLNNTDLSYFDVPDSVNYLGRNVLPKDAEVHLPDKFISGEPLRNSRSMSYPGGARLYVQNEGQLHFYGSTASASKIYLNKSMTITDIPLTSSLRDFSSYTNANDPATYYSFNMSAVPGIKITNSFVNELDATGTSGAPNHRYPGPFMVNGIHIPLGESFYFGSFEDLENLIGMADEKESKDYTTENWNNLQNVISKSKTVLNQKETLDDNNVTLFKAYAELDQAVRSEIASDEYKKQLNDLVEKADAYSESEYLPDTWESFADAKTNAEAALEGGTTTYDVDKAYERLKNVMDMMIKKSEIASVLYVGWMELPSLQLASESMYHKGYINYSYVTGFDDEWNQKDNELAAIDYTEYDIVVFDMIGVNDVFEAKLKDAAEKGTSFIAVNCGYNEPDYFVQTYPDKEDFKFYRQMSDSTVNTNVQIISATMWGEKFLLNLVIDFTNTTDNEDLTKTIEMLKSQKFEAVYLGPEGPNGAEGFKSAAGRLSENIYGNVVTWTAFEKDYPDKINELKTFLNERKDSREPLVILCDSFTAEDWECLNEAIDLNALAESGTVILSVRSETTLPEYVTKDLNLILTSFGYTPEEVNEASFMLYRILNQHGTDQPKAWKYITPPSGKPLQGLYNLDVAGNRIYFDNVKDYLAWYKADGSVTGHKYNPDNYTVGIWCHDADIGVGNATNDLIKRLEENGINVIMGYETFDHLPKFYCHENGTPIIDAGISVKNFGLNYWDHDEGIRQLEEMNVPIIKGIFPFKVSSSISDSNNGIDSGIVGRSVLSANRDGLFEFIVLGYNQSSESEIFEHQVDWAAEIIDGWGNLNRKENDSKNVALIYYNYPPGKADIGANYLNVMRSFAGDGDSYEGVLRTLQANEYDVDFSKLPVATMEKGGKYTFTYNQAPEDVMTEENLMHLMYSQGINIGSHAPGVLDSMVQEKLKFEAQYDDEDWWGCQLIPMDTYLEWLEEDITNETMKNDLFKVWGKPWEEEIDSDQGGMIWTDEYGRQYLVIPAIRMGNVWIMPQPDRALAGDKGVSSTDYHGDLPPTHQYIAFYLWLNRGLVEEGQEFKPDAAIHFGTHGTHEWLPGTAIGLDRHDDWAPSLIQGLPNIYPYIMANVGEGLTAEFRGNALIIDHLTPAMLRSGLYGDLLKIDEARQGYMKQISLGESSTSDGAIGELVKSYRKTIVEGIFDTDSVDAMNLTEYKLEINAKNPEKVTNAQLKNHLLSLNESAFRAFVDNHVHTYIESVLENSVPYGMHVYGKSPDSKHSAAMIRAMWGNYGFEKVIEKAYFTEVDGTSYGIPQTPMGPDHFNNKCDEDVFSFVADVIESDKSTSAIEKALEDNFGTADPNVVYFIKGPMMYAEYELAVYQASDKTASDLEKLNNSVYDKWMTAGLYAQINTTYEVVSDEEVGKQIAKNLKLKAEDLKRVTETKNREFVNLTLEEMRKGTSAERAIDLALTNQYSVNNYKSQWWINEPVINFLTSNKILTFLDNLENSGPREMQSLLNALDAGYIPPTSGNDPIQNPDALPTGANFYGIDPGTFPTHAAWDVGQAMGEQILADYYLKHGKFPDTISFTRFGVEFIRDEGSLEACIFYLLGTYPTWLGDEHGTGAGKPFKGVEVMSPDDPRMQIKIVNDKGKVVYNGPRPRVDIVYTTAGMRDGYGKILMAVQDAVNQVYELGDQKDAKGKTIKNYVTSNTDAIAKLLEKEGMSKEEAKRIAKYRTFGQELGHYEIGTGNMISSGSGYETEKDIADLYLDKMGYVYNSESWGEKMSNSLLKVLLGRSDASVFASSSNLYDNLDNDDVFQYFGAKNMVSSMYDDNGKLLSKSKWQLPEMYIADTSNVENFDPNNPGKLISTMREAIKKDMDSRYLNPEWIQGMMESGYSGATLFAEFVENMYGWSVISNGELITFEDWQKVYDIYVDNKYNTEEYGYLDLSSYFETYSYNYQSITGRMLEAIRHELIHTDNSALTKQEIKERETQLKEMQAGLMTEYIKSVVDAGVACCHHTCGNPAFDEFMAGSVSVLGLTSEEEEMFWQLIKDATGRDKPEVKSNPNNNEGNKGTGSGFGIANILEAGESSAESGEPAEPAQQDPDKANEEGDGFGTDLGETAGTQVSGFEMTVSQISNSVKDFIQNPTFSTSSIIAIAFVVIIVGAIFYGSRRRNI